MPTAISVRDGSAGPTGIGRRGAQKAYVPFNDDVNQGRRTGIAIGRKKHDVLDDSDDMESFGELLGELDHHTPPRALAKKAKTAPRRSSYSRPMQTVDEEDTDGYDPNGPHEYFQRTRPIPPAQNRGNRSQPIASSSQNVDFDAIPSPRPSTSSNRRPSKPSRSALSYDHLEPVRLSPETRPIGAGSARRSSSRTAGGQDFDSPQSRRSSAYSPEVARRQSSSNALALSARSSHAGPLLDDDMDFTNDFSGPPLDDDYSDNEPLVDHDVPMARTSFSQIGADEEDEEIDDVDHILQAEMEQEMSIKQGRKSRPSRASTRNDMVDEDEEERRDSFNTRESRGSQRAGGMDGDEEAEHVRDHSRRTDKGKGRAVEVDHDEEESVVEEDIEQGLAEVNNEPMVDEDPLFLPGSTGHPEDYDGHQEEDEEEEPVVKSKKRKSLVNDDEEESAVKSKKRRSPVNDDEDSSQPTKKAKSGAKAKAKGKVKAKDPVKRVRMSQKENIYDGHEVGTEIRIPVRSTLTPDRDEEAGPRRGRRVRYEPLEWWRLEKVVYGGQHDEVGAKSAQIKEIIRIPKEVPEPLGKKKRKNARTRSKSRALSKTAEPEEVVLDPEEGWDDKTEPDGLVIDFATGKEIKRRLACTKKMLVPKLAMNKGFYFQKVFSDGEFVAAGLIVIPPKGEKSSKNTKDNTYIFYVIEGAVTVKVHRTASVLTTGGMILVPRGNMYNVSNICERDAKIFFAQARKMGPDAEELIELNNRESVGRSSMGRMSSAAPGPSLRVGSSNRMGSQM